MSQNSMRYNWTAEEVDAKLHQIMKNIFSASVEAAHEYGLGDDLIAGANIAGFLKVGYEGSGRCLIKTSIYNIRDCRKKQSLFCCKSAENML